MSQPSGYLVSLLEDRASLWPSVKRLLPKDVGALAGSPSLLDEDPSASVGDRPPDRDIGLVCWSGATREEIAGLAGLRARHPGPLVAVLAKLPNALGARVLAARLEGAILAAEIECALLPTLAAVAVGQCVVPRAVRQVVDRPPLSPRERQILAMIVLDFSNAEIAHKLFVTESNVKNHLSSAFQKLGVKSRSAAAELILDRESGLGPGILRISPEESLPGEGGA
jgi:DNA-binding NarL/FixJ family response regulator